MLLNKKESKAILDLYVNGATIYKGGNVNTNLPELKKIINYNIMFGKRDIDRYHYVIRRDAKMMKLCLEPGKNGICFQSNNGWIVATFLNADDMVVEKKTRQKRTYDIFWSYLRLAQYHSDNAKKSDANKRDIEYFQKQEYIDKAIKRAVKQCFQVYYDDVEECVYFETSAGQCSFHDFRGIKHFSNFQNVIVEQHQWNGKHDTYLIIESVISQ